VAPHGGQLEERSPASSPQNVLSPAEAAAAGRCCSTDDDRWLARVPEEGVPGRRWVVEHGTLKGLGRKGGDILTTATSRLRVRVEWRLSFQGQTGLKYFIDERRGNTTGAIGHEYR